VSVTEFKLSRAGEIALVTIDNGEDHRKPTVFDEAALESLARTLDAIEADGFAGLLITGKPYVFSAGADLKEFPELIGPGESAAAARAGHELFGRITRLPIPTLAAINGICLGGGLELALFCRYRTISTAVRHFGFPECFLGLVPSWGGTQLAPRLVGPKAAVEVVVLNPLRQNRLLDGPAAFEKGFADRLFGPAEFLDESLAFLHDLVGGQAPERLAPDWGGGEEVFRRARARVDDLVHGATPAPYRALELLEGARRWSLEEGFLREQEAAEELIPGRHCQASVYAFDLVEQRAKRGLGRPDATARTIERVGIVGAGLMATQIAALVLQRLQVPLVISDIRQEALDEAIAALEDPRRLVTGTTAYDAFAGCDLVIEAIFEDLAAKQEAFARLEAIVGSDCVLATNTSALSISALAEPLAHAERLVGMHFFNPVAVMPLVEIVRGGVTDDSALATAFEVALALRKRPVIVADAPGFVVNRVLTRMLAANLDALERGSSVAEVDAAMLSLGLPMAPSALLQLVGPRVASDVLATMHAAYPERFPPPRSLERFDARRETPAEREGHPSEEEILADALAAIADEIRHLLDEGVVAEPADVDTCLILGAGFPFFLGGITRELEARSLDVRPSPV
jgi:3-hydroxyacyl-CoA dehydrogenase/enoyl-CoA hydratase/carnithine racemase